MHRWKKQKQKKKASYSPPLIAMAATPQQKHYTFTDPILFRSITLWPLRTTVWTAVPQTTQRLNKNKRITFCCPSHPTLRPTNSWDFTSVFLIKLPAPQPFLAFRAVGRELSEHKMVYILTLPSIVCFSSHPALTTPSVELGSFFHCCCESMPLSYIQHSSVILTNPWH